MYALNQVVQGSNSDKLKYEMNYVKDIHIIFVQGSNKYKFNSI